MTTFLSIYLVPVFVCSILLYLRRPQTYVNRRGIHMIKKYRNHWVLFFLGMSIMLYLLTVAAALHMQLGWFSR